METEMSFEERARRRRKTMVGHKARGFAEAEQWDLEFWQKQTPQDRLSALAAIRRDIAKVNPDLLNEE